MSAEVDVSEVSTESLMKVIRQRAGLRDYCACNFEANSFAEAAHYIRVGNLDEALTYLERSSEDLVGLRALVSRKLRRE